GFSALVPSLSERFIWALFQPDGWWPPTRGTVSTGKIQSAGTQTQIQSEAPLCAGPAPVHDGASARRPDLHRHDASPAAGNCVRPRLEPDRPRSPTWRLVRRPASRRPRQPGTRSGSDLPNPETGRHAPERLPHRATTRARGGPRTRIRRDRPPKGNAQPAIVLPAAR